MPLSKNLNTYADVKEILDTAHKAGGASYTLSSPNEALRWRQRAYYYRTLLFNRDSFTKYDSMKLRLSGKDNEIVHITFNTGQVGTLKSFDGKELKPVLEVDDKLLAAATKLAEELK